jgi:hypothetical protein
MKVNNSFLNLDQFHLGNGHNVRFWEDKWLENFTLQDLCPTLFAINWKKHILVASVFSTIPLNISFQRGLVGNNLNCR